jgi:hypothetical protein
MGIIKALLKTSIVSVGTTAATFALLTRKDEFVPVSPLMDELLKSKHYAKLNPNNNPVTHDLCIRRVPLSKIKPPLRENPDALTRAFCAGVWSGNGMTFTTAAPAGQTAQLTRMAIESSVTCSTGSTRAL